MDIMRSLPIWFLCHHTFSFKGVELKEYIGARQGCSLEVLARVIRQEKEIKKNKRHQNCEGRSKTLPICR